MSYNLISLFNDSREWRKFADILLLLLFIYIAYWSNRLWQGLVILRLF
jgi:hypothetical protein